MKKVILLFILFMLPSTSVFAASSVVAIKENEIVAIHLEQNNKVITLNKGEDFFNPKIFDNKQFVAYNLQFVCNQFTKLDYGENQNSAHNK